MPCLYQTWAYDISDFTSSNPAAIRKLAVPPASLNVEKDCTYFPGLAPAPRRKLVEAASMPNPMGNPASSHTPNWEAADRFFAKKGKGLANLTGVTDLDQIFAVRLGELLTGR